MSSIPDWISVLFYDIQVNKCHSVHKHIIILALNVYYQLKQLCTMTNNWTIGIELNYCATKGSSYLSCVGCSSQLIFSDSFWASKCRWMLGLNILCRYLWTLTLSVYHTCSTAWCLVSTAAMQEHEVDQLRRNRSRSTPVGNHAISRCIKTQ